MRQNEAMSPIPIYPRVSAQSAVKDRGDKRQRLKSLITRIDADQSELLCKTDVPLFQSRTPLIPRPCENRPIVCHCEGVPPGGTTVAIQLKFQMDCFRLRQGFGGPVVASLLLLNSTFVIASPGCGARQSIWILAGWPRRFAPRHDRPRTSPAPGERMRLVCRLAMTTRKGRSLFTQLLPERDTRVSKRCALSGLCVWRARRKSLSSRRGLRSEFHPRSSGKSAVDRMLAVRDRKRED